MGDVGSYLKREREAREISLQEISEKTKISVEFLKAIENNEFDKLPAEVFAIGFIRNYARYLGLNEDEVVNMYKEFIQEQKLNEERKVEISRKKRFPYFLGFSIAAIIILIIIISLSGHKKNNSTIHKSTQTTNAPTPLTYSTATTFPTSTTTTSARIQITIVGKNTGKLPVYVQYCSDDSCKHPRSSWDEAYLKEGEKVKIEGEKIIGVMTDDGGKVVIYKNGKSLGPLGKPGSVKVKFFRP